MYGNILPGSYILGDKKLGVFTAEATSDMSQSQAGVLFRSVAVFSSWHTLVRNTELDITISFKSNPDYATAGMGVGSYGSFDEFGATIYAGLGVGSSATFAVIPLVIFGPSQLGFCSTCDFAQEHPNDNSIAWSNIGSFDFTLAQDNTAGHMPINLKGYIYAIEQLNQSDKIIVYGPNGITQITPAGVFYGSKELSRIGVKGKQAIINTGSEHYFITKKNEFYKLSTDRYKGAGFKRIGYKEFLSPMGYTVLSYDSYNELIYICDGTYGYIYSITDGCFSSGPTSITGLYYQDDETYAVTNEDVDSIAVPAFSLSTDIYDMGTKKDKTISKIILDANDFDGIYASIDYKTDLESSFSTTPSIAVTKIGWAVLPCFGKEFRFNFTSEEDLSSFILKSITIEGIIH